MKKIVKINGMRCNHCKNTVEKAISEINGVNDVIVDLDEGIVNINFDDSSSLSDDMLRDIIDDLGFEFVDKMGY